MLGRNRSGRRVQQRVQVAPAVGRQMEPRVQVQPIDLNEDEKRDRPILSRICRSSETGEQTELTRKGKREMGLDDLRNIVRWKFTMINK